jgi:hypothetical protein
LYLGSSELSLETLDRYSTQLRIWGKWNSSGGDSRLRPSICSPSPVSFTLPLADESNDSDETLLILTDPTPHLFLYGNIAVGDAGSEAIAKLQHLTGRKIVVNPLV